MLPLAMGAMAGGSLISGLMGSSGAKAQIEQMKQAIEYQKQKDAQTRTDLTPYRKFGGEQLNSLSGWLADPNNNPESHLDPGYNFRLEQGNEGITNNAATAGLLQSGDTLRGLQTYGQDMASQEYDNAFDRYINEGNFKKGMADVGKQAILGGGALANEGAANVGRLTADTDWGGPDKVWGEVAGGIAGAGGNAFARMAGAGRAPTPGGANVFAGSAGPNGMKWPW